MLRRVTKKDCKALVEKIREFFSEAGFKKAVVGLSGGIDSAVSAKLVAEAIGSRNLFALIMPEEGVTLPENIKDAVSFCKSVGIGYYIIPINPVLDSLNLPWTQSKLALINTKARIRAALLYNYANSHNAIVIGTSNRTELLLGYFTKYGDGAVDVEVIGSLYKTQVFELARMLKIPERIISKTPSAELYPSQSDEAELGASYEQIDAILNLLVDERLNKEEVVTRVNDKQLVIRIAELMKKNRHKLDVPPVIDFSSQK